MAPLTPPATSRAEPAATTNERGSATLLATSLLTVSLLAMLVMIAVADVVVTRARAQTAADAAALAGVVDGSAAEASALAGANGAALESFSMNGDIATVTVRIDRVTATAKAERRQRLE